jgi:DNA-binding MarR family transcriptional regulator
VSTGAVPPPFDHTAPEEARAVVRAFLSEEEELAWRGLLETHARLIGALDARLIAEHNTPLGAIDALIEIAHTEGDAISVSALAERLGLSPSRVSRLAIDLQRQGLVERRRSSSDSRSTELAATDAGRARLLEAAPGYFETIRELLIDPLGKRQLKQLGRIWERLRAAHGGTGQPQLR